MSYTKPKASSVVLDILLTFLTLGLWNLWVQLRQINTTREILKEDPFFPIIVILLLTIFTFGLYFWYHEYKLTRILHQKLYKKTFFYIEFPIAFLTFLGLWFIVDSYQQHLINLIVEA